jgi:hypothetical protein
MSFSNGKINLRIYKIVRLSRVPRSQNAFDEFANNSTNNVTRFSFDSETDGSQLAEVNPTGSKHSPNWRGKTKKGKNDIFEETKQDDNDYPIHTKDVDFSMQNDSYAAFNDRDGKGFDSSNEDSASSGANHSQSQ